MLLSIVTYLGPDTAGLDRTALSVANQEYAHIEWIIIDCLEDRAQTVLPDQPSFAHYVRLTEAESNISSLIKGQYVMHLQPGEIFGQTQALQKAAALLIQGSPQILFGDYWIRINNRHLYKKIRIDNNFPDASHCALSSVLIIRKLFCFCLGQADMQPENLDQLKDYIFRYAQHAQYAAIAFSCIRQKNNTLKRKIKTSFKTGLGSLKITSKKYCLLPSRLYVQLYGPLPEQVIQP